MYSTAAGWCHGSGKHAAPCQGASRGNSPPASAKGEPTARLARELGLSRKQLHTLRQRIQANINDTAPTAMMVGTAFEADELYQNAGEKKHTAPRSLRSAPAARQ